MQFTSLISSCNKSQKEAILSNWEDTGPLFLLAGAGSGKTFVLTNRIIYLILNNIAPDNILALTFTKAAAEEMSHRVKAGLKKLDWSGKGSSSVTTFHSLGYKIINEEINGTPNWKRLGFVKQPRVIDTVQKEEFIKSLQNEIDFSLSMESVSALLESPFFSSQKSNLDDNNPIGKAQIKFTEYLLKHGLLTFGDMVYLSTKLLKKFPDVLEAYKNKYRYVLVDEYQDTSPDQFELIDLISSPHYRLFLVGDDDQAIYGFRGADKRCIDKLFEVFSNLKVIKLELNYRSTSSVLKYANTIFKNKPQIGKL